MRIALICGALIAAPVSAQQAAATGATSQPAGAPPAPSPVSSPTAAAPAGATTQRPVLDARTHTLAQVLELTDQQQHELAKILAGEREHIRKVWQAANVPPEYRASATRAIKDKTEEQIRGMLTEAQKKKYIADRPAELPYTSKGDLDRWLNPAKPNDGK